MKLKNILITLTVIFLFFGILIYIEPTITGFAVQERMMISNVSVSADKFDQEIKVKQFDDYEIKMDNALYYFTANAEEKQDINYILIEFMVDSAQAREYTREEVSLYYFNESWIKLETEFIRQDGRFYYYEAKAKEFGLFAVAPVKEEKIAIPKAAKNDLIIFGLIPIFAILLLFIIFSYSSVRLIQRINYRFYLVLKKLFFGLVKFVFSFAIVVLILCLISPSKGDIGQISLIYYAVIPLIILTLISNLFLNLILKIHRLIEYNRVYKLFRNLLGLFIFVSAGIAGLLLKLTPKAEGSLGSYDIIIYGIIPPVCISSFVVLTLFFIYKLSKKLFYFRSNK